MGGQQTTLLADSYCDWWTLSGVDTLVGENPADWLVQPLPEKAAPKTPIPTESVPIAKIMAKAGTDIAPPTARPPAELPAEWGDFQQWLAKGEDVPGSQWDARRVIPVGPANAPLMVLTAWPEVDDQREGALFTGAAGRLIKAMLRAIGQDRADCYIASLAITRPPGGRCSTEDMIELQRLMWHHVQVANPGRLLLMGNDIARIFAGLSRTEATGKLLNVNQHGVNVEAVAIPHPATLLSRPAQKAAAWDSLKLFNQGR